MNAINANYAAKVEALRDAMFKVNKAVTEIEGKHEAYRPSLFACICGAPTFQQPCPHCGYYPDAGAYRDEQERYNAAHKDMTTREVFVRSVEGAGGFVAFYAKQYRRTVLYTKYPEAASRIDTIIAEAVEAGSPLTAEELWDAFHTTAHGWAVGVQDAMDDANVKQVGHEVFVADLATGRRFVHTHRFFYVGEHRFYDMAKADAFKLAVKVAQAPAEWTPVDNYLWSEALPLKGSPEFKRVCRGEHPRFTISDYERAGYDFE